MGKHSAFEEEHCLKYESEYMVARSAKFLAENGICIIILQNKMNSEYDYLLANCMSAIF